MGEARRKKNRFREFFPEADIGIVQAGDPVLRERAQDVPTSMFGTEQLTTLVETMVRVMRQAPGVGLAAPQIGVGLQVAVIEDRAEYLSTLDEQERKRRSRDHVPLTILINPKLTLLPGDPVDFDEGCLSVRGYVARVPRAHKVMVQASDLQGQPFTWEAEGWPARIIQHECDHLAGTLYLDHMDTRTFTATD